VQKRIQKLSFLVSIKLSKSVYALYLDHSCPALYEYPGMAQASDRFPWCGVTKQKDTKIREQLRPLPLDMLVIYVIRDSENLGRS
jgi:hypothetical protein